MLSYAVANNDVFRFDSNYFQKQYLVEESVLRKRGSKRLIDVGAEVRSFGAYSLNNEVSYLESGVPFIRGVNMKDGRVNFADMLYISEGAHSLLWKSEVKDGMVLLSMSGTIGDVAIATSNWPYPVNSNQDIAKIDTRGRVNPFVLYAYLLSRYGQNYLRREARGSVQQHVFLSQIEQIEIPSFGPALEAAIQRGVEASERCHARAETLIADAEASLLSALGLDKWTAPESLSYVRTSHDVLAAGRIDAEYFHPAKTHALNALAALSDQTVRDNFHSVRELWQPDGGPPTEFVRNYDLTDALDPYLDPYKQPTERSAIASAKKVIAQGDLVVSRLRSYLREIAMVLPGDAMPTVASTEFIVLRPTSAKGLAVEALLVYLRSHLPQIVFKWSQDGSNHPRFDEQELLNLPVPRRLLADQEKYIAAVRGMVAKRQQAARLLDNTKRAVEMAIETNEANALTWLRAALDPELV
jgi:Type I restriction modification DNA specificity domain